MTIEKITNIDLLVQLRLDYFANDSHVTDGNPDLIIESMRRYFMEHIEKDDFVALAIKEGNEIISVGFLVIQQMPANGNAPNGLSGMLLNILTYRQHRRKGYGKALIKALIEEGRKRGLSILDLYATEQGAKLYEKMGFITSPYKPMRLKL